jgi:uncharacterized protein (DUF1330 family)
VRAICTSIMAACLGIVITVMASEGVRAQNLAPAYLVAEVQVTDAAGYGDYAKRFVPLLEPFGGRIVVRGGTTDALEGAPIAGSLVIITFPSMDKARQFWNSPAYQALIPMRQKAATGRIYIVEGLPQ